MKNKPQPPYPQRGYMMFSYYGHGALKTFATNRAMSWGLLISKVLGGTWTKARAKESGYRCHPVTITPEVK